MLGKKSSAKSAGRTRAGSGGRGFRVLVSVALLGLLLQGCMVLRVRHPLPEHLLDQVQIANQSASGPGRRLQ